MEMTKESTQKTKFTNSTAETSLSFKKVRVEESLRISSPSWPLQNTVAVNPFWFLREKRFEEVMGLLEPVVQSSLLMPIEYYRDQMNQGRISRECLREALEEASRVWPGLPRDPNEFLEWKIQSGSEPYRTVSESAGQFVNDAVISDLGKYCAAYLDENQAIAGIPGQEEGFLELWFSAQTRDRSMRSLGFGRFQEDVLRIKGPSAEEVIGKVLDLMKLKNEACRQAYLSRSQASILGWSTQFKHVEWQKALGYVVESKAFSMDLLAVRVAYDFAIHQHLLRSDPARVELWRFSLEESVDSADPLRVAIPFVYQLALELSYQREVASSLKAEVSSAETTPEVQMVFCIDVRSEMIRRHIETLHPGVQTLGFAGFFGVALESIPQKERASHRRLPVLLTPGFQVEEKARTGALPGVRSGHFFRSLRKNPLSSFLYVELFGAIYVEKMLRKSFASLGRKSRSARLPERFRPRSFEIRLELAQKLDRVEGALRHMGLIRNFAPVVMIVGHGSETTNNAFGSSLDCGACGGHAGDLNARVLVELLNDSWVREGLGHRGIPIPESTQFVACVHETVRDEVHILDSDQLPKDRASMIAEISSVLAKAARATREERQGARSDQITVSADRRASNWSEVRPEWGLAGNACFIVAPRSRTLGIDLGSRSFLHDYDHQKDEARGYATLELIMTAPMVVTNWINMQYYGSTVSPSVYGSGNKVLHNVVNENGVLEGNGGDLKVGLPIQSVHDGVRFVHDPLRLSVFIEAPRSEMEKIISKHAVVRDLVENGWLHLLQIEPETGRVSRRLQGGRYVESA